MQLSVMERLNLLNIMPKEGDFTTLKIIRVLKEELSFSEEEHKLFKFIYNEGGGLTWTPNEKIEDKDVTVGEKVADVIVEALKKLNDEKKLSEQFMSLYEKFVEEKE